MAIIATYADDPSQPTSSAVRHLVTDATVNSITDAHGSPILFTLESSNNGQFTYEFTTANAGNTLNDGNYFADGEEFYSFFGDFNGDRVVDATDAAIFTPCFNTLRGQVNYRSDADWNDDGAINNLDAREFSRNYGKTLPA